MSIMLLSLQKSDKDINRVAQAQRKNILTRISNANYKKDTQLLEKTLNDFFYTKNNQSIEYKKAMELASQAFNERYEKHNFSFNSEKLTATFTNKNIKFLNQNATLQEVRAMAKEIEQYFNGAIPSTKISNILGQIQKIKGKGQTKNAIRDINSIIASILFGNKTVYGDAFELPLAAFSALVENGVNATLEDLVSKVSGGKRSYSTLNISNLSKKDRAKLNINNTIAINDGLTLRYNNPTQDKVDVVLQFQEQTYDISAKSYTSIYQNIHILGGTPLTAPVLNLSSTDFINNYLTQLYYDGINLTIAHNALRLNILFMALTGTGQSSSYANTFIINDKSKKRIYVRNMNEIITSIMKNEKWNAIQINEKKAIGDNIIPDIPLRNFQQRKSLNPIADMISEMHKIKLMVSLKGTAIRDSINKN